MTERTPSGRFGLSVAVVVAATLVAAAILITMYPGPAATLTHTSTSTLVQISTATVTPALTTITSTTTSTTTLTQQSLPPASTNTTASTTVSCTVSGEGGPVFVQLYNYTFPLQGVAVSVVHVGPMVNGQPCGTIFLPTLYTNSTGWVEIPGDGLPYAGSLQISFTYSLHQYNSTVKIEPVTTTYVYFFLPPGSVSVVNCDLGICPTMTSTMGMSG